jgi:hypothetical protein
MLHFVKNFTEDRTFKVIISDTKSEKITNGVVQGAVLSVTLFLIAIREMADKTKEPSKKRPGPIRNQTILSQRTLGRRRNANTNGRNTGICGRLGTVYKESPDAAGPKYYASSTR